MKKRRFLMMRTRGLGGPRFGKYKGYRQFIKSIGNAFSPGGPLFGKDIEFALTGGWAGLENCGGQISGRTISLTGGWTGTENCGGSISGKSIDLLGGWTGQENCK